tara:strand:+ start:5030 stop:6061 length:1032 start_codon:yes stop_codon:yes gene_type:complete
MKKKIALITGITGQDGSYLAEYLVSKNYEVHGIRRRASIENLQNLKNLNLVYQESKKDIFLHYGDMTDSLNLNQIVKEVKPHEVYNLAAQSHVHLSFSIPEYTAQVNAIGCLRLLEAVKSNCPKAKFYQASTSELYGNVSKFPQNEKTPFDPCSPYSISKHYAFNLVKNFRERGMFACNGILFNHESPRRGTNFVTRKIVEAAVKIKLKKQKKLFLGNLYAKRDWGYAKEYVEAMWKMLQQKNPNDFVISTNKSYSVKQFIEKTFTKLNIKIVWKGKGLNEKGLNSSTGETLIEIDPFYFRPREVNHLRGNNFKAKKLLKWKPKTSIDQLIDIMIKHELKLNK